MLNLGNATIFKIIICKSNKSRQQHSRRNKKLNLEKTCTKICKLFQEITVKMWRTIVKLILKKYVIVD